ncbi:MAG: coproporphyrinogen III oxidase, partial [Erysipelotrichaceae bacterium]
VEDALSLKVPHLSLYSLTIEENSVFGKKGYKTLDEDTEADMYEYIIETLKDNGYHQYEIANFSIPGYESKHNLGYWHYDDYLALGPGSTSKYNHKRIEKTKNIKAYLENNELIENIDILSNEDEAFENLMMSLRLEEGLNIKIFKERYGFDPLIKYSKAINKNKAYLKVSDDKLICTCRAILNLILIDFMD